MNSLIFQIVVIGVSIAIITSYVQPKFSEIRITQDEIAKTQEEHGRVTEVNNRLAELYSELNAVPQNYRTILFNYLPERVDDVRVMKELAEIARRGQVIVSDISYDPDGGVANVAQATNGVNVPDYQFSSHVFSFAFEASYEQLKSVLDMIEKNNYPLKINTMSVKPTEGGLLGVNLELETYGFLTTRTEQQI